MNLYNIKPYLSSVSEVNNIIFDDGSVKIEHIISTGQASPDDFWYDQNEHEWITVLEGYGIIEYRDGSFVKLEKGDNLLLPAHKEHRVKETANPTIWLAVFFNGVTLSNK